MENFVHFSNRLEELAEVLKSELYPAGALPFERRLIVVPHLGMKAYLMQSIAKDPKMQVAAGLQIVNLDQAYTKITKKRLPSSLELSLFIQYELKSLIKENEELLRYFSGQAREARIGPFCDALSSYFLRYGVYGKKSLPAWQEILWKKVSQKWTFPKANPKSYGKWQIHLFGFSHLPKVYLEFFQKLSAKISLFSPCQMFWGDYYSDRERSFIGKEVPQKQLDFFEQSFAEQNPLLANWGRVGRFLLLAIEDSEMPSAESYIEAKENSCLSWIQNAFLEGLDSRPMADESIRCFSANTKLREIEILKEQLIDLFQKKDIAPADILVFAPDMNDYAPYIHGVFGSDENTIEYAIGDLEIQAVDPIARAFSMLIALPKNRFSKESMLQLFTADPFREKFHLNIEKIEEWISYVHIRWGFSKEQRRQFYLQEFSEDELVINADSGTWEKGLSRLLLGLGNSGGDDAPLPIILPSEMEHFDRFYTLIYSLQDDLSVFHDGTKWTLPTWLRFFACLMESYFVLEPDHEIYRELLQLASSIDHLDQREFPYGAVERVLTSLLSKKSRSHQAPHMQATRFASLKSGCALPAKVICLLGMGEEFFPRKEENSSLYVGEEDFRPKKNEEDRYLFLELLLSARERVLFSYVREEKSGPSALIDELFSTIEGGSITHHPDHSFDPSYFQKEEPQYSQKQFLAVQAAMKKEISTTILSNLFPKTPLENPPISDPIEIDVQKLAKFARHPIRHFFHEILRIYPKWPGKEDAEYLLPPLTKYHLVQEALQKPLEEVWQQAKNRGEIPLNLWEPFAKGQIASELEKWNEGFEAFGIQAKELSPCKIDHSLILENGQRVRLFGNLENCTPNGVLVPAKDTLEDRIRFWPQGLLAKELDLGPLLLLHEKEKLILEGSLPDYIQYYLLAKKQPSPFLPIFAKALLEGAPEDLIKAWKKCANRPDEVMGWLFFCDPAFDISSIHEKWSLYLQNIFGRIDATV